MSVGEENKLDVDLLCELIRGHASEQSAAWFEKSFPSAGQALSRGRFFATFAGCARRLKDGSPLTEEEAKSLREMRVLRPQERSLADFARLALLRRGLSLLPQGEWAGFYREILQKGDSGEQISALFALPLLPEPTLYLEFAIDASRTNIKEVFTALANDNPYPAEHFPELNFNQLVMKALFMGVPAGRVVGLEARTTPELVRMARDYASERRAAGRPVPDDVQMIEGLLP